MFARDPMLPELRNAPQKNAIFDAPGEPSVLGRTVFGANAAAGLADQLQLLASVGASLGLHLGW
jgi:hypothetical protein